jgi:subtilisin-like proprotein convertase family protein
MSMVRPLSLALIVALHLPSLALAEEGEFQPTGAVGDQWHLKSRTEEPAGANVRAVWPTAGGTGAVIGIVDDGLQHTHPALQPNYSSELSLDFNNNDPDPSPVTEGSCWSFPTANCHGTAVAGVAAARGDNGVFGAAPLATLAGLRLIAAGLPPDDSTEAAAFRHQPDAIHITNNSWGPLDDGRTLDRPGPFAQAAIEEAIQMGRGGRGRIFVWAAGNGLARQDNCNFDGYANNRFVIAVAALADNAQQAPYSEPCSAMFVTAPSSGGARGITTTDLVGSPGYDPTDYTNAFGGTSSAAPLVSGVAALMLSVNPALTWRDVKHILVRTSVKVAPTDPGWSTGPFPHNEKFGFGLVDAEAAVNRAATWTNVAAESRAEVVREVNQTIPDNDPTGLADSVTFGSEFANFAVEHVEVEFTATHPYRGDLEVTLTSPSGVMSRLATARNRDFFADFSSWPFSSVRHWGEGAAGTWTLRVTDGVVGDEGTWTAWKLRIFGTRN